MGWVRGDSEVHESTDDAGSTGPAAKLKLPGCENFACKAGHYTAFHPLVVEVLCIVVFHPASKHSPKTTQTKLLPQADET